MEDIEKNDIWKGTKLWTHEIEKAGVKDQLRPFNDVITENRPPHPDSSYGDPVLTDVILDGKSCDIYHTDHKPTDTYHRIFIHIKE